MINDKIIQVMQAEMDAIALMIAHTQGQYDEIVEQILACRGKLVFMGVGKSGHIGEKLAATFSSTGTPSFFVHAVEAMHGDFGMIQKQDVVILISNSGNTTDVVQDLPFLCRIGCTTIAMTSNPESALAEGCDFLILYPHSDEADHLNLAPTVSSTLALTLGDALACTLSQLKGFSRADFYKFHPGGALGEALLGEHAPAEDPMPVVTVVGSFVTDMVAEIDRFPQEGETLLGKGLNVYLGGKGINQCVALQRLGIQTEMIGMLGDDENGDSFRTLMEQEKIVSHQVFCTDKVPTAVAQIQIDANSQNKIVVIPSSNYAFELDHLAHIEASLSRSKLVVTQLELKTEVVFALVRRCHALNIPVLLNPAPAAALPEDLMGMIDYLVPNEVELSILTNMPTDTLEQVKAAAMHLIERGVKHVVVTLGSKGALTADSEGMHTVPGYNVANVVDTVGAGDSFIGALAKCIIEGKTLVEGARYANAMGALTVSKRGAIPSLHTGAEVDAFIRIQEAQLKESSC